MLFKICMQNLHLKFVCTKYMKIVCICKCKIFILLETPVPLIFLGDYVYK